MYVQINKYVSCIPVPVYVCIICQFVRYSTGTVPECTCTYMVHTYIHTYMNVVCTTVLTVLVVHTVHECKYM